MRCLKWLCLLMPLLSVGCLRGTYCDVSISAPIGYGDPELSNNLANQAWNRILKTYPNYDYNSDFAAGFVHGYGACMTTGEAGELKEQPAQYRRSEYLTAEGQSKAASYMNGWKYGVEVARVEAHNIAQEDVPLLMQMTQSWQPNQQRMAPEEHEALAERFPFFRSANRSRTPLTETYVSRFPNGPVASGPALTTFPFAERAGLEGAYSPIYAGSKTNRPDPKPLQADRDLESERRYGRRPEAPALTEVLRNATIPPPPIERLSVPNPLYMAEAPRNTEPASSPVVVNVEPKESHTVPAAKVECPAPAEPITKASFSTTEPIRAPSVLPMYESTVVPVHANADFKSYVVPVSTTPPVVVPATIALPPAVPLTNPVMPKAIFLEK